MHTWIVEEPLTSGGNGLPCIGPALYQSGFRPSSWRGYQPEGTARRRAQLEHEAATRHEHELKSAAWHRRLEEEAETARRQRALTHERERELQRS